LSTSTVQPTSKKILVRIVSSPFRDRLPYPDLEVLNLLGFERVKEGGIVGKIGLGYDYAEGDALVGTWKVVQVTARRNIFPWASKWRERQMALLPSRTLCAQVALWAQVRAGGLRRQRRRRWDDPRDERLARCSLRELP
jgi:hypothetical protein